MAVLVTGAGGFIGRALVERLVATDATVRALTRQLPMDPAEGAAWETLTLAPDTPLPAAWLDGVEVLYHLAAVVHRPRAPERERQRVNVAVTAALARQAAAAGVRRFVFLSSVAAQATSSRRPLTEDDPPRPETAYGRSKLKAEAALAAVAAETGLEATVLRPPLVIGPGAPGNVARLLAWARAGRPLPQATLANRRSLVGLGDLVEALLLAGNHPAAANETFLVAGPEPWSTGALYQHLAGALGLQVRFLPLPALPLRLVLAATGRHATATGLFDDLLLDAGRIVARLGWQSATPLEAEIDAAGRWLKRRSQPR